MVGGGASPGRQCRGSMLEEEKEPLISLPTREFSEDGERLWVFDCVPV